MNKEQYYFSRSESRKPESARFQSYLDRLAAQNLNYLKLKFIQQNIHNEIHPEIENDQINFENSLENYVARGANRRKTDHKGVKINNYSYREHTPKMENHLRFYQGEKKEIEVFIGE